MTLRGFFSISVSALVVSLGIKLTGFQGFFFGLSWMCLPLIDVYTCWSDNVWSHKYFYNMWPQVLSRVVKMCTAVPVRIKTGKMCTDAWSQVAKCVPQHSQNNTTGVLPRINLGTLGILLQIKIGPLGVLLQIIKRMYISIILVNKFSGITSCNWSGNTKINTLGVLPGTHFCSLGVINHPKLL